MDFMTLSSDFRHSARASLHGHADNVHVPLEIQLVRLRIQELSGARAQASPLRHVITRNQRELIHLLQSDSQPRAKKSCIEFI